MIIITGALGFIGSNLIKKLNQAGLSHSLIGVDDLSKTNKEINVKGQKLATWIDRSNFIEELEDLAAAGKVSFIFHLGARTDTTEKSVELFNELNLNYTKSIWTISSQYNIPMVYASSAATYGNGEKGYNDDHQGIPDLVPMNPYGQSKQDFDVWALKNDQQPPFWAGLKFFNVYGPNESQKGRMASVVYHITPQIKSTQKAKLFRSHRPNIADGQQKRDFIFIDDIISVLWFLYENQNHQHNGIYNLGTGQARSFKDLAIAIFTALDLPPQIEYFDIPEDIRDTYQYFTEANMHKLRKIGYTTPFTSLEDGVKAYVKFLLENDERLTNL